MVSIAKIDAPEIQRRAAEIRGHWSLSERIRRTGLPPDIPPRLREYIVGSRDVAWPTSCPVHSKPKRG